jgi:hypothetical protein
MEETSVPMRVHELGSGAWINIARYPMVRRYTPHYLAGGGGLQPTPPAGGGTDTLLYAQPGTPGGSVTYTTKPLADGATLAGPISATLHASSSATNLNVIATLYDVAPDGGTTELTSGSLVGSLRALDRSRSWLDADGIDIRPYGSYTADDYLVPGRGYALTFRLLARVARIAPGHALRLTLTSQTPAMECAAVLGTDPCYPTAPQALSLPGTYSIERSPATPSAINLPLLPYACFPADGGRDAQPADLGDRATDTGRACRLRPSD